MTIVIGSWFLAFVLSVAGHWIGYGWMFLPILGGLLLTIASSER